MLNSSILYYKTFRDYIETIGFEINPYDICEGNQTKYGKQQILTWHINDLKSIHMNTKVNDEFSEWRKETYGCDNLGHVKVVREQITTTWV